MEVKANEYFTNLANIVNQEEGRNCNAMSTWTDFRMNWLWSNNTPIAWRVPTTDQIYRAYGETFGRDELEAAREAGKVFENLSGVSGAFKP